MNRKLLYFHSLEYRDEKLKNNILHRKVEKISRIHVKNV